MASELAFFDAIATAAILALFCYIAYLALAIRRSLAVGLYRRQALWAASLAFIFIVLISVDTLYTFVLTPSNVADLLVSFLQDLGVIGIFAWIDTSTLIARRSDPLLRDSVHWTKLRLPLWAIILGSLVAVYTLAINEVLAGISLSSLPSIPLLTSLVLFLLTPFAAGVVVIPLSAVRSKDPVFRRHLAWFSVVIILVFSVAVLAIGAILGGSVTGFLDVLRTILHQPLSNVAYFAVLLAGAFALQRSVRSLVPMNRVSEEKPSS